MTTTSIDDYYFIVTKMTLRRWQNYRDEANQFKKEMQNNKGRYDMEVVKV